MTFGFCLATGNGEKCATWADVTNETSQNKGYESSSTIGKTSSVIASFGLLPDHTTLCLLRIKDKLLLPHTPAVSRMFESFLWKYLSHSALLKPLAKNSSILMNVWLWFRSSMQTNIVLKTNEPKRELRGGKTGRF